MTDSIGTCALCLEERLLRKSHVIPEFMYRPGYDEKGRMIQVDATTGGRPWIQQGYREKMLCDDCEELINENYEKPINRAWYERDLIGEVPSELTVAQVSGIQYHPFKLFHLSVLWRAGVATAGGFEVVKLGPHREKLRQMVYNGEPGEPDTYPIIAVASTNDGELAHGLTSSPAVWRHEGMRVYAMIYGGFEWGIGVASHCPRLIKRMRLTREGTMLVPIRPWNKSDLLQQGWRKHLAKHLEPPSRRTPERRKGKPHDRR